VNTIQRYVLREILAPTGLGLLVFTFVFLTGTLFKLINDLANSGVPVGMATELILLILPRIMAITVPMSILVGVLLGIGRLAADREILAVRASGISLTQLIKPVIIFAIIVSGLMMWANMRLIPYFNLKSADLLVQVLFRSLSAMPEGVPVPLETEGAGGESTIFVSSKDPDTGKMHGISILTKIQSDDETLKMRGELNDINTTSIKENASRAIADDKPSKETKNKKKKRQEVTWDTRLNERTQNVLILAQSGIFEPRVSERVVYVRLTSGSIHLTDPDEKAAYDIVNFGTMTKGIVPRFDRMSKGSFDKDPVEMSTGELKRQISVKDRGRKYSVELYQRFSVPLACIAFALIAFPLAIYVRPTGKAVAFGISFLLILVYYGLLQYGVALGHEGNSLGPFAIFLPNLLIAGIGCFLLYRMVTK